MGGWFECTIVNPSLGLKYCYIIMLGLLLKDPLGKQCNKHNTNFTIVIVHITRGPSRAPCTPDLGCH